MNTIKTPLLKGLLGFFALVTILMIQQCSKSREKTTSKVTTTATSPNRKSLNKDQKNFINNLIKEGDLKVNAQLNRVDISLPFWNNMDYSLKKDFSAALAVYVGNKKGTHLYWVDIYDMRNGKKLAKYSESWGFKVY